MKCDNCGNEYDEMWFTVTVLEEFKFQFCCESCMTTYDKYDTCFV